MESVFQNCVSEFDLNFFEQTTNVNQATPLTPCSASRKLGIARIKDRLKGISQVVHKAKNTNEILLEVQKELMDTKQELEETRNLLFEKNEEHKVTCDERNKYFNQATEYSNKMKSFEEQLKKLGDLDFNTKLKDKIINGYSDQMKGLQTEMDNLLGDKKQKEKNAMSELKQSKANIAFLEKKLIRLLKEYIAPETKKRDRWLRSIIKKHLPEAHVEDGGEESDKVTKTSEDVEKPDECGLDVEDPSTQPVVNRNISLDFDYVGSVDTGRGSSLAFSDGEKGFHSPDYCMDDSPISSVSKICNKCNVPKTDVSTSPISPERSGVAENSAANVCQRCVGLSKKDSCTSPIPLERLDAAINTSDIEIEITTPRKHVTSNSEEITSKIEPIHMDIDRINQTTCTPNKKESPFIYNEISLEHTDIPIKEPFTSLKKLEDFTFDSDDEDRISDGSGFHSDGEELNPLSTVCFDKVVTDIQKISGKEAPTAAVEPQENIGIGSRSPNCARESPIISPSGIIPVSPIQSGQEAPTTIKLGNNTVSDVDEVMQKSKRASHMFSPIDFDDSANNCNNITSTDHPTTPTKLQITATSHSETNVKRNSQQELQCLELNNSKNCRNDIEIDSEIRTILNKMRLNYQLITPIPATPRRRMPSPKLPVENQNPILGQQAQVIAEAINEQFNLLRSKIQEVFTPFVETIPEYLEQIPRLFSHDDLNEELLRNLLCNPNTSYVAHSFHEITPNIPSYNTHTESNNRRQPDVVDLNTDSMLCITETNNENSTYNNYTIIEQDSDTEDQMIITESSNNTQHEGICRLNSEICNTPVMKAEKSDLVSSLNVEIVTDSVNSNDTVQRTHQNTQELFNNSIVCDNIANENSNRATTPTVIESRNSIVYEGKEILDDYSELDNSIENDNENPEKVLRTRRGKKKKASKLETLRLRMLPKSKIQQSYKKLVKKMRPKPILLNTVPKKKVTASDTAASLNEKSVYENAVKVLAALSPGKEPRVVIEDCVTLQVTPVVNGKNSDENKSDNSSKLQSPTKIHNLKNNKRKLSENLTTVPKNHALDSNESTHLNEPKKVKRTDTSIDEEMKNKSPKSPSKTLNRKRTQEAVHTSDSSETKDRKEKRTSVSDVENLHQNSKPNDNNGDSPRILRSSSFVKHNKETGFEVTPVVRRREGLRSTKPETHDNTNIIPLGKKSRIARQTTRSDCENTQAVLHTAHISTVSEISGKYKTIAGSNEPTRDQTVDQNKLEIDDSYPSPPKGRKSRIARQTTRSDSEKTQDVLHTTHISTVSEISGKYKTIAGSNEPTQTVDQNKLEIDDSYPSPPTGRKSRIARQKTNQVDGDKSNVPEISKKSNSTAVSYADLNEVTQNRTVDRNELKTDPTSRVSPEIHCRITRQKTNRNTEIGEDDLKPLSEILKKNTSRVVSYADLNLFSNEVTQNQTVDQNELETNRTIVSPESNSRITRQKTSRNSESRQDGLQTLSKICKQKQGSAVSYADLNLFSEVESHDQINASDNYRKDSLLCRMIEKYGVHKMKYIAKQAPEVKVLEICNKLETNLTEIVEVPHEKCQDAMKRLVAKILTWDIKLFILGFINFLRNPERKLELFNKSICPPYPPMTKKEQVLLYVLDELQKSCDYRNIVQRILTNIEYTLLALNKTPESFEATESMSHFYALLCRSYQKISQLRLFIIDAMYCLQLKAVALVHQCLEVWMFALPLGHMGLAKCPIVTCLVYLIHFYKCNDKQTRVQDLRNMLRWKYNYDMADWNENKILDLFRTAIVEIRDSLMERKTLRLSLLILAKRNGAKWCHSNIVKNMLQPLISDGSTSDVAKCFCLSLLGPLLKPYPANMKVHYEMVIDYLMGMLHRKNSQKMQEAIISSLIYIDKNNNRFFKYLAKWNPKHVSPEFEFVFKDYVKSKTLRSWKQILSWQVY